MQYWYIHFDFVFHWSTDEERSQFFVLILAFESEQSLDLLTFMFCCPNTPPPPTTLQTWACSQPRPWWRPTPTTWWRSGPSWLSPPTRTGTQAAARRCGAARAAAPTPPSSNTPSTRPRPSRSPWGSVGHWGEKNKARVESTLGTSWFINYIR